ncbi:MAG: hypothetical protein LAT57_07695, partial [Balneolales bacterium]|nr:hypothetical protein [Balneolales bacterium]
MIVVSRQIYQFVRKLISSQTNMRNHVVDINLINSISTRMKIELFLLEIPQERCVTNIFWKLNDTNPFVKSLLEQDLNILKKHYEEFQPNSINNLLGIELKNLYGMCSPGSYVMPWQTVTPEDMLKQRNSTTIEENTCGGYNCLDLFQGGHTDYGPVSFEKYIIEKNRILKVYNSIKINGYQEDLKSDRGIHGYFLINSNNDWRFLIVGGKHRAYALSALGNNNIPVVVNGKSVLNIKDYKQWNHYK